METEKKLQGDVAGSIAEFQEIVKQFDLRFRLYRILYRGKGLEFEGFRTFENDDDADAIDWKVSARANRLMVKQYKEERDMKFVFVIDVGSNMVLGSEDKLKCERAMEVVAALAHLILSSGDKVGFLLYNEKVVQYIPPGRGNKHFDLLLDSISNADTYRGASNILSALDFMNRNFTESIKSVVFVSDFLKVKHDVLHPLFMTAQRFEAISIQILDKLDFTLPKISGEVFVEDSSTGERLLINPNVAKKEYEKYAAIREREIEEIFRSSGIDLLKIETSEHFVPKLAEFLKERVKKRVSVT